MLEEMQGYELARQRQAELDRQQEQVRQREAEQRELQILRAKVAQHQQEMDKELKKKEMLARST